MQGGAIKCAAATQDALGHYATTLYDSRGRAEASVDVLGNRSSTVFDSQGRAAATINALGYRTSTVFDSLGRAAATIDALGNRNSVIFDSTGRQVATVDPLGHYNSVVFDAYGRQVATQDALGGLTSTVFDTLGRQQNLIDASGNKTTFLYDALGRLSQQIDPRGFGVTYAYDAVSRLVSRTDRDGRRVDTGYDSVGNKTTETWVASNGSTVDQRLTFTYDARNQQLTAANGAGTYSMVRDALGRVTSEQDVWGLRLTFSYDALSRRTVVADSLGGVTTSTFDFAGNLTRRDFGGSGQTPLRVDQTYNAASQVTAINRYQDLAAAYPGALSSYTYNASGLLTHYQHFNGSNSSSIANVTLSYDSHNRLTVEQRNASLTSYTYDNSDQLTADGASTVTYDATGNRNNGSNTTTTGNRLTTDGTWNYSYDDEGNETKKVNIATGVTWTFGYDQANHLKHVEHRTTDGGTLELSADYKYDAWGNRVEKSVDDDGAGPHSAAVSRFAYDGWNPAKGGPVGTENFDVWADLDGSSSLTTRYLRSDKIDELFARTEANGDAYWYLTDHLGSVRDITDIGGYLKDTINYDGFGNISSETNPQYRGRYAWTGREFDVETGLQCNRARYYDATTGRWISQDPMGFDAGDSNLYRYVRNQSTHATDPSGLDFWDWLANDIIGTDNVLSWNGGLGNIKGGWFGNGSDFISGWGDNLTIGFTGWIRNKLGYDDVVNHDSGWYLGGEIVGTIHGILLGFMSGHYPARIGRWAQLAHKAASLYTTATTLYGIGSSAYTLISEPNKFGWRNTLAFLPLIGWLGGVGRAGREFSFGPNFRIAPFGNRTGHPIGRWPHYHRRVIDPITGKTVPGQGIGWHRPWEGGW